jgi:tetratricopeptide (TPR) repeat protein
MAVILTAPVLAFVIGLLLGRVAFESKPHYQYLCGLAAMFVSVFIILLVSYGRMSLLRLVYSYNRNKLTNEVNHLLTATAEDLEKEIEEENTADKRYQLASVYLLAKDYEKSIHQFEQAQVLQAPTRPQDLNNLAVAMAHRGQISSAYERFEKAVAISPLSPEPKFNLAKLLNQTGREVDAHAAKEKLKESVKLLKKNGDLLTQLGMSFAIEGNTEDAIKSFKMAATASAKPRDRSGIINARNNIAMVNGMAGKVSEARSELTSILKVEPENARAIANAGVLLLTQRKYFDAVERLKKALQIEPDLAIAHCDLGYAYCMTGAINDGIREFRAAVLLDPHIFEAQYNLGKAYLDEGILDVAEKSLMRAVQLRITSWQVHHAIGVLYYNRGLYDKAISSFTDSLKLSPHQAITLSAIGVTYVHRNNMDTAYDQLKLAMAHNTHNAEVLTNLSWVQISNDELHDASDTAKRAIAADDAMAKPHNNLGLCQLALGAAEVAQQEFQHAIQLDPSLVKVHHHLGSAHIAMKQIDNAIKEWKEATQVEPGNSDIYTNLGVAYYRQTRVDDAIAEFRRSLKFRTVPRKEDYINLGLALASAKHHKEAIEQFDKALQIDPRNAIVHSNRGLACYFGNNVEEAMREWQLVTQLDPAYAKRRGKKQQTEYDDAIIEYIPLNTNERALFIEPHTPGYMYRYLPGYETDKWMTVAPIDNLEKVVSLNVQIDKVNRQLRALDLE